MFCVAVRQPAALVLHLHHHKTYIGRCAFRLRFAGSLISAGVDQLKGPAGQGLRWQGGEMARKDERAYVDVLFSSGRGEQAIQSSCPTTVAQK